MKDKPLNEVLHQLRDQYGLQLSYTENELSKYKVSVQKQFETDEETLNFLLNTLPFRLKKAGKVFIIIPLKKGKTGQKSDVHISGQIVESGTREPLSYSNIIINKKKLVADVTGSFNFIASADSSFHLQISHLGYFVFDTVLYTGIDQHFTLKPSITPLPEIKVQNRPIDRSTLIGDIAGNMKINHNIAQYLPGQGDNSIFNLLRLMPGIQATNEQSADLQLSGSQEGQSLMTFDGFTLFGLKNYNNNISIINPFLVKNINIYQGSFPAQYGNRVGGLVQMIGKNGSLQKPTFSFNLNATTVNGMAELPLFRKSSLVIAYRQTYYNLYNSNNFNIYAPTHSKNETTRTPVNFNTNLNGFDVYPDNYRYRDFNAKYTINPNKNDQLYFSLYLGGDKYRLTTLKELKPSNSEDPPETRNPLLVDFSDREKNSQDGFSAFYSKKWSAKISSEFLFSRSSYSREAFQNTQAQAENTTTANTGNELEFSNTAKEYSFRNENRINRKDGKELTFGAGFYTNKASLVNINSYGDSLNLNSEQQFSNTHLYAFVKEHLPIGKKLIIDGGIRFLVANDGNKFIAEPRFSMQYKFTENLKLNVAGGRYHQFMYKLAHVDRDNNYNYFWVTSANSVPVLNATHYCLGLNYYKNSFTANVESYYKKTNNLSRQVFEQHQNAVPGWNSAYINYTGDAKAYGISTYLRKDFGNQAIWTSYNWSKALERLAKEGDALPGYVPAINDQRHEFKIAALLNYKRFYFSSDFVYGSGQKLIRQAFPDNDVSTDYQRVDLALTYKLNWEKSKTEFGVSVLNIFDRKNLSYNHLRSINLSPEFNVVKVYTNAVPLTPTIFLKIVF
ncbi:TonB-dependent receptor domain-containing protein [Mangrovibacterium marinum]|uniref:TonB-dependent receptor domain-containing protein n=1 Tax=Mangrovibacterium marinum TaxID=1639118 RepID=UPI00147382B8|nr:TonB-dependent receptor [Mangrovibacterium marinum]